MGAPPGQDFSFMWFLKTLAIATLICLCPFGAAEAAGPLTLENGIPLGELPGRIDHLAYDAKRGRLIIAELGNNSVSIVDLDQRAVIHRITDLNTPQGVAYQPSTDTIYVASAGDGLVRRYSADQFVEAGRTDLGDDADNIRIDHATNQVVVGYGGGALAVLDAATADKTVAKGTDQRKSRQSNSGSERPSGGKGQSNRRPKGTSADFPLPVHPEGFELDLKSQRIFVNLAGLGEVGVIDRQSGKLTATWRVPGLGANFPMAIDEPGGRVLAVFRNASRMVAFEANSGAIAATVDVCTDSDDIFADTKRGRLYVICGSGMVDVLDIHDAGYRRVGQIASARGARTGLYVPERDRLYVAAPAAAGEPAAILVFRPSN